MGGGGAACLQPFKFELQIAEEGRVYKIWDLVYKIVQNEYKIMIQFFTLELHLGGLHVSNPQIWIADSGRRKIIQDLGLGVQNCTK